MVPVFGSGGSSKEGFLCVSVQFKREDGSGSGFGSWKTVPAVPVPRSVPGKTAPTVPGFGFRFGSWATLTLRLHYHSTENHYITSRYFPELIMSDVM